jgi:predicted dehydrogenase
MRLAVIGCGAIGEKRAEAARGHEIVVAADLLPGPAERLATKTGARATTRWQDAIAADVDAVIIATMHDSQAEIALAAVEAGKHVLVEKPAGRSAADVAPVAAAARKLKRTVKVGFNHRFHPAIAKAHAMATAGEIGPLFFIRGRYGHGGRLGYELEWRCDPARSGGGELIDQGSHLIDLSRWFLGDLELIFGTTHCFFWHAPVEDNCFLALRGAQGQLAWLHASWTEWKNLFSLEIMGRDGKLAIDGLGGSYGVERLTFHRMLPGMGPPETTLWEYPFPDLSWHREFDEFVAAIAEGRPPVGSIEDALANLQIVDRAYGRDSA